MSTAPPARGAGQGCDERQWPWQEHWENGTCRFCLRRHYPDYICEQQKAALAAAPSSMADGEDNEQR